MLEHFSSPPSVSGTVELIRDDAGTGLHGALLIGEIIRADPVHFLVTSQ